MAPSHYERQEAAREERLVHMREQVASGELTVRQMTRAERERWDQRAAEADRRATPDERARREAARARLRAKTERAA